MQHTGLISYHLTKEVMKSALLLLFIPPIMSWSNSSHSHAIQKDAAVCIQVTTAGTAELAADVRPGTHLPGAHKRTEKEGAIPPGVVTHLNPQQPMCSFAHFPQRSPVRVSGYWTALCVCGATYSRMRSRRTTATRGRETYACNQEFIFIPSCVIPHLFPCIPKY